MGLPKPQTREGQTASEGKRDSGSPNLRTKKSTRSSKSLKEKSGHNFERLFNSAGPDPDITHSRTESEIASRPKILGFVTRASNLLKSKREPSKAGFHSHSATPEKQFSGNGCSSLFGNSGDLQHLLSLIRSSGQTSQSQTPAPTRVLHWGASKWHDMMDSERNLNNSNPIVPVEPSVLALQVPEQSIKHEKATSRTAEQTGPQNAITAHGPAKSPAMEVLAGVGSRFQQNASDSIDSVGNAPRDRQTTNPTDSPTDLDPYQQRWSNNTTQTSSLRNSISTRPSSVISSATSTSETTGRTPPNFISDAPFLGKPGSTPSFKVYPTPPPWDIRPSRVHSLLVLPTEVAEPRPMPNRFLNQFASRVAFVNPGAQYRNLGPTPLAISRTIKEDVLGSDNKDPGGFSSPSHDACKNAVDVDDAASLDMMDENFSHVPSINELPSGFCGIHVPTHSAVVPMIVSREDIRRFGGRGRQPDLTSCLSKETSLSSVWTRDRMQTQISATSVATEPDMEIIEFVHDLNEMISSYRHKTEPKDPMDGIIVPDSLRHEDIRHCSDRGSMPDLISVTSFTSEGTPPQKQTPATSVTAGPGASIVESSEMSDADESMSDVTDETDDALCEAFEAAFLDASSLPLTFAFKDHMISFVLSRISECMRSCPSEQPSENRTAAPDSSSGASLSAGCGNDSSNSTRGDKKRAFTVDGRDLPGDDDGDDQDKGRRIRPLPPDKNLLRLATLFACPFSKEYPDQKWPKCHRGWPTVHRVKEHIYRSHELPIRCVRCFQEFKSGTERDRHCREDQQCQIVNPPLEILGVDSATIKQLRSRKGIQNATEDEKWRKVFTIIFPTAQEIPSPYFNLETIECDMSSETRSLYHAFLRRELPDRVIRSITNNVRSMPELEGISQFPERRLSEVIHTAVWDAFDYFLPSLPLPGSNSDALEPTDKMTDHGLIGDNSDSQAAQIVRAGSLTPLNDQIARDPQYSEPSPSVDAGKSASGPSGASVERPHNNGLYEVSADIYSGIADFPFEDFLQEVESMNERQSHDLP